jgi:hypothetical protein
MSLALLAERPGGPSAIRGLARAASPCAPRSVGGGALRGCTRVVVGALNPFAQLGGRGRVAGVRPRGRREVAADLAREAGSNSGRRRACRAGRTLRSRRQGGAPSHNAREEPQASFRTLDIWGMLRRPGSPAEESYAHGRPNLSLCLAEAAALPTDSSHAPVARTHERLQRESARYETRLSRRVASSTDSRSTSATRKASGRARVGCRARREVCQVSWRGPQGSQIPIGVSNSESKLEIEEGR